MNLKKGDIVKVIIKDYKNKNIMIFNGCVFYFSNALHSMTFNYFPVVYIHDFTKKKVLIIPAEKEVLNVFFLNKKNNKGYSVYGHLYVYKTKRMLVEKKYLKNWNTPNYFFDKKLGEHKIIPQYIYPKT